MSHVSYIVEWLNGGLFRKARASFLALRIGLGCFVEGNGSNSSSVDAVSAAFVLMSRDSVRRKERVSSSELRPRTPPCHGLLMLRNLLVGGAAGLLKTWLWRRHRPLARWRVSSLIRASHASYAREDYSQALSTAFNAKLLAATQLGEASSSHESELFHVAAVHAAMREHAEALSVLRECDVLACKIHGVASVKRMPIYHALAEVFEAEGTPADYREAVRALQKARELRLAALGSADSSYARSCLNEAGLLVRFANETPILPDEERGALTERAVDAVLEEHAAASTRSPCVPTLVDTRVSSISVDGLSRWFHPAQLRARVPMSAGRAGEEEGNEYLDAVLKAILRAGFPNRLGKLTQCAGAIQKLRDAGAVLHTDEQAEQADSEAEDADETD